MNTNLPTLTIEEWRNRNLPAPDFLMGSVLTTTTRMLLTAATGLGKSNFSIALGMRVAAGMDFLHWRGRRRSKVLYLDGEMARRLLRERVIDEARRVGSDPNGFFALSHEDIPGLRPLNTLEGQAAINGMIKQIEGVDLVIFDNIMSLAPGDLKDPEPWAQIMPWCRSLTSRRIGQIWVHHTGIDETRSYGDKTREWQLDCVAHLDAEPRSDTDLSFKLSFKKARERTPATRTDFEDVSVALVADRWEFKTNQSARVQSLSPKAVQMLKALTNVIDGAPVSVRGGRKIATTEQWKAECHRLGVIDLEANGHSARTMFARYRNELAVAGCITRDGDLSWTP